MDNSFTLNRWTHPIENTGETQSVLLYYPGRYPKSTKPIKDVLLPTRLWPNARMVIYGNFGKGYGKNKEYFERLFGSHRAGFQLVEKTTNDISRIPFDALFIHHENYNLFGGIVGDGLIERATAIQVATALDKLTVVFFNDELFAPFNDFRAFLDERAKGENFLKKNPGVLERLAPTNYWGNVILLGNEDRVSPWLNSYVDKNVVDKGLRVMYLSDFILYDLPRNKPSAVRTFTTKQGCYVPLFTDARIKACDRLFTGKGIPITFAGSRSDELHESIRGNGKYIENHDLPAFLQQHDWTIYIGKGRPSAYLGATFYEPLLKGIPVFVWRDTDQDKRIFGEGIDCYFSTAEGLQHLLSQNLNELYDKQVSHIWDNL